MSNLDSTFNNIVLHYSATDSPASIATLESLVAQYPWFSLAHYALLRATGSKKEQNYTDARSPYKPYPAIAFENEPQIQYQIIGDLGQQHSFDSQKQESDHIFLSALDQRLDIVDDAINYFSRLPTPQELESQYSDEQDIDQEESDDQPQLVTETLAQIYLAQGHQERAIEIYLKLSLTNPEKSRYFVDLINNITPQ